MKSINKLREVTGILKECGIERAQKEAEILIAYGAGIEALEMYRDNPDMTDSQICAAEKLLSRRLLREPLSYIIGHEEFMDLTLEVGDASHGWGGGASFDVIVLTGSTPVLPGEFQARLKVGGRLFAIVGDAPIMQARLITCIAPDTFETVNIMETCVAPLQHAQQPVPSKNPQETAEKNRHQHGRDRCEHPRHARQPHAVDHIAQRK